MYPQGVSVQSTEICGQNNRLDGNKSKEEQEKPSWIQKFREGFFHGVSISLVMMHRYVA
jgi:hypothetical protein